MAPSIYAQRNVFGEMVLAFDLFDKETPSDISPLHETSSFACRVCSCTKKELVGLDDFSKRIIEFFRRVLTSQNVTSHGQKMKCWNAFQMEREMTY